MNEVEEKFCLTNLLDDYYSINFMKMAVLGFEYTSSLVDLLLSPGGSSPLYQTLVPRQFQEESIQEKIDLLENHLVSHGLNSESVRMLLEAGVRSLQLLALLGPGDLLRKFHGMPSQQRRLLEVSIRRLDPRPSFQVTAGLKSVQDSKTENGRDASEIEAALKLVENSKKILECPVCYLPCQPPRIWQCNNGHLTCATCHVHT